MPPLVVVAARLPQFHSARLDAVAKRCPLGHDGTSRRTTTNGTGACGMHDGKAGSMGARRPPLQQQQQLPTSTIRSGARSIDRPGADKGLV